MNAPTTGSFAWFDFATKDETKLMPFYQAVFAWKFISHSPGYWLVQAGDKTIGGLRKEAVRDFRPAAGFVAYFTVPSVKEAAGLITKAGGVLVADAVSLGEHGNFQLFQDPEANQMAVWSLKP